MKRFREEKANNTGSKISESTGPRKSRAEISSEHSWAAQLTPEVLEAKERAPEDGCTVSVAIPSSVLKQGQSKELRTHLIGRIARTLALFQVDEVVVFVDSNYELQLEEDKRHSTSFSRILQYIETPPYLRKELFPMSSDLKFCGMLPPLETPHHMRRDDKSLYREGVTLDRLSGNDKSLVNVGQQVPLELDRALRPGTRVTVRMALDGSPRPRGKACSPTEPRAKYGLYWGYQTRVASSLGEVFSGTAYRGGYDVLIGCSPKSGDKLAENSDKLTAALGTARHVLVVFGGDGGIEACVDADESIQTQAAKSKDLFDLWLGFGSAAGTRKLRTEEELMLALAAVCPGVSG